MNQQMMVHESSMPPHLHQTGKKERKENQNHVRKTYVSQMSNCATPTISCIESVIQSSRNVHVLFEQVF